MGVGFLLSSKPHLKHSLSSCYPRRQREELEKPDSREQCNGVDGTQECEGGGAI